MIEEKFELQGTPCQGYRFLPDGAPPRAALHVVHGMAEHALRYRRLAEALVADGWVVYAHDQRGHGATATDSADRGWFGDSGGWARVVDDLQAFLDHEAEQHPGIPRAVFGHSMGSFVVQDLVTRGAAAQALAGVVLSGVAGPPPLIAQVGRGLARVERWRKGPRGRSAALRELSFGAYNRQFKPTRTAFDWLSKDPAEVDKYAQDPMCGFDVTNQLWVELLDVLPELHGPTRLGNIPKALPVYVFAGQEDPVGRNGQGVEALVAALKGAGLADVEHKLYPTGRHEMLNEINREEVVADLRAWLGRHGLPPAAPA